MGEGEGGRGGVNDEYVCIPVWEGGGGGSGVSAGTVTSRPQPRRVSEVWRGLWLLNCCSRLNTGLNS